MGPYLVTLGDCAGTLCSEVTATFPEALRRRDILLARNPRTHAFIANADRMDVGDDGLTEEERDEL